jgi:F0F1-type ATP synthase assembly protein I
VPPEPRLPVTTPPDRRPKYQVRTDDDISQGMEAAGALAVFFLGGWLLDRWLGTVPVFMIVLTLVAAAGITVKLWVQYETKMRAHEAERELLRKGEAR